jgi:hypothetical protein
LGRVAVKEFGEASRNWSDMDAARRCAGASITREMIPMAPGVYAWYRAGRRVYVGKADSLRARLWRNHLGQSSSLSGSAFRRNVAEHLGYGRPKDIKAGVIELTAEQLAGVRAWILGCELQSSHGRHRGLG